MRNRFLVSYDVSDAKRLRRVFKKMCGFGDPVQYSVFLCPLSAAERTQMIASIKTVIHHQEDRVMVIDLGPTDGRGEDCIEFVGRRMELPEGGAVVL